MSSERLAVALADRYRIERELGQGGMATVYLAHDLRHDRKVALKVLRPDLAAVIGAERFLQEIRTTANLQHPHILPLHDSGQVDGTVFYVMPFVEGESLRDRLVRDKQLPIDEAVRVAREVADALGYAHEHGIIHRDIKPENILLQRGHALVADFGIALAASKTGGSRMTETGMSLGTPHYMSPEQAMGDRDLGPRSDVYALGCVCYEMLCGEPPFTGPTPQAIVARVMTEAPRSIRSQRQTVPEHVEAAVLQALEKLPADRFSTASDFAAALSGATFTRTAARPAPAAARPGFWRPLALTASAVAVAAAALALWGWLRPRPEAPVTRHYLGFAPEEAPPPGGISADFSRDGSALAYMGPVEAGGQRIWVKRRNELRAIPLAGTQGASAPFFSPDGRWIAFFAGGKLRKIPAAGGTISTLADAPITFQWGGWLEDGRIVYSGPSFSLQMVNDAGGTPETVVTLDGRGAVGAIPLPGSRGVLFAACGANCLPSDLWVLDLETRKSKQLLPGVRNAFYSPTGHLVYNNVGSGVLLAAPFDLGSLTLTGPGAPAQEGVARYAGATVASDGTLMYQEGEAGAAGSAVWVSRAGIETPVDTGWRDEFNGITLSPDGRRLAATLTRGKEQDVWIKDLDRASLTRLTFGEREYLRPAWNADGRIIYYVSGPQGRGPIHGKPADGSGEASIVQDSTPRLWAEVDPSPDGQWLLLRTLNAAGPVSAGVTRTIHYRRVSGDTTIHDLPSASADQHSPALSPDGKWLAYVGLETERAEVYVRPFPNTGQAKYQVSVQGGFEPVWAHSGKELFYVNGDGQMIAAELSAAGGFTVRAHRTLFQAAQYQRDITHRSYAVAPGDQRFLMVRPGQSRGGGLVMVTNWFAELRARLRK